MSEADDVPRVEGMDLIGGDISMDFVNTASGRTGPHPTERLRAYADLVTWAERAGLLGPERADRLRRAAAEHPVRAGRALEAARTLRDVIHRVFTRTPAADADLEALARAAAAATAARRLEPQPDGGYAFVWPESDELEQILWPVALSAAELLTSKDRARVKECANDSCRWLFLDRSKNRSRRWCLMRDCGNQAKARRFRARMRENR